jgi:hypothetical protein
MKDWSYVKSHPRRDVDPGINGRARLLVLAISSLIVAKNAEGGASPEPDDSRQNHPFEGMSRSGLDNSVARSDQRGVIVDRHAVGDPGTEDDRGSGKGRRL